MKKHVYYNLDYKQKLEIKKKEYLKAKTKNDWRFSILLTIESSIIADMSVDEDAAFIYPYPIYHEYSKPQTQY